MDVFLHRYFFVIVCIFESKFHGFFSKIVFADPLMNHPQDLEFIENYYQCPKNQYYDPKIHGKEICRKIRKSRKPNKDDPLLKSSQSKFPFKIKEEDASAFMGDPNVLKKAQNIKKFDAITKFGLFFLREQYANSCFIAHNR